MGPNTHFNGRYPPFFLVLVALIVLGLYNGLVFFPVLLLILGPPASLSPADDGTSLPPPTPQPSPPRFKTKHGPNRAPAAPTPKKISSGKPKRHNSDRSLSTIAAETHSHSQSYCNNNSNSSWDSNSQESEPNLPSSTHSSPGKRQITHSSPYGKRPVPAPRSGLGDLPLPASAPVTPGKRSGSVYASNQSLCPKSNNIDKVIMENSQLVSKPVHVKDTCLICQNSLGVPGGHDPYPDLPSSVISLMRCQHRFHLNCVRVLIDNNPTSIKNQSIHCPDCGRLQRDVLGSMPENGTMSFKVIPKGLPGFEDYHSIQITYNFQNGTQSPKHPSPGKPYFAIGFPKTAFLPDTEQGRTILEMLEKSFNLGHTFLVDEAGDIVWGHIPHRTEFNGEPMTMADLDAVMTALFKIGLGASDC